MVISVSVGIGKQDRVSVWLVPLAIVAGLMVVGQLAVMFTTGVAQETFEVTRQVGDYGELLRAHAGATRLVFSFDSALIVAYAGFFVLLARRLATDVGWLVPGAGLIFAALFGLLDAYENQHILSFLALAEAKLPIDLRDITAQMALSQLKFHLAAVSLFFFGLAFPRDTWPARVVVGSTVVAMPLLALALFVVPAAWFMPLNEVRWAFYAVGLPLAAWVMRPPSG